MAELRGCFVQRRSLVGVAQSGSSGEDSSVAETPGATPSGAHPLAGRRQPSQAGVVALMMSWLTPFAVTLLFLVPLSFALLAPVTARAEIYRWMDAEGHAHFSQDLGQVPPSQRAAALERSKKPKNESVIQRYEPAPASRGVSTAIARRSLQMATRQSGTTGKTYQIPVSRAGTSMIVTVRLNNRVNARFLVDTGASDVLLPQRVADQLGLEPSGRTKVYSTANGMVEHEVVSLDSVSLGGATARGVMASISPSMSIGLLGLSFFNHFKYEIDPVQGTIRLTHNGLEESGQIRAGRSKAQWKSEYRNINSRIRHTEERQERVMSSHTRTHAKLEEDLTDLERQLAVLDGEADQAHVPFSWRR